MFKSKPSIITSAVLLSLGLSACGGSSKTETAPVVTNVAPTAVALSNANVSENIVAAVIGNLTVTDADAGDTHTLTVSDDRFEVDASGVLKLKAGMVLNLSTDASIALKVTATDKAGLSYEQDLTLTTTELTGNYAFTSQLTGSENKSSVSYGGQTARQVLIIQLTNYIGSGLQADYDAGKFTSKDDVVAKLMAMYAGTSADWEASKADTALNFSSDYTTTQSSLGEISSSHKNLQGKIAGKDEAGQHNGDWTVAFEGWNAKGSISPDLLVQHFFGLIGDNVQKAIDGDTRINLVDGANVTKFYLQTNGLDLKQLTQKFLLGAVNFSQGADDYLDYDLDGKGLNSANITGAKDGAKPYTSLEHTFDEGFGYFGAARNYNQYTDLEIRAKSGRDGWKGGYNDINGDGKIDLTSEINLSNSTNAAKRDVGSAKLKDGSANPKATDFTKEAFDAFLAARTIISKAVGGEFTTDEKTMLQAETTKAVEAWEKTISATIVHYINEVINDDLATIGTDEFNYANLAKHWSELKGFSLGLQFNRHSPVTDAQFTEIQALIGMQPALNTADAVTYKADLLAARDILQAAYQFDAATVKNW